MTAEQCHLRAVECLEEAQKAREPQRQQLLELAQAWIKLAEDSALVSEQTSHRHVG
jgi:hypothetical protein